MRVFFYGLFMDVDLLAAKGIFPSDARTAFLDGYSLRIGERATLVPDADERTFGILMDIGQSEVSELYSEASVADYVPETVLVELADGEKLEATSYNLPADKVIGTNSDYAKSLLKLADRLGFPDSYLDRIRRTLT